MKAKPIEPGCLALVLKVHPSCQHFVTNPVRVLRRDTDSGEWVIDAVCPGAPDAVVTSFEQYMVRIDDPDIQREIEEDEFIRLESRRGIETSGYVPRR